MLNAEEWWYYANVEVNSGQGQNSSKLSRNVNQTMNNLYYS